MTERIDAVISRNPKILSTPSLGGKLPKFFHPHHIILRCPWHLSFAQLGKIEIERREEDAAVPDRWLVN